MTRMNVKAASINNTDYSYHITPVAGFLELLCLQMTVCIFVCVYVCVCVHPQGH